VDVILRAAAAVAPRQRFHLAILGEGEQRAALEQLAAELGIADRVFFLGFQPQPWLFVSKADLFVLSSRYEGFGNVLIEAMRQGVPVVSTDCPGGPSEILEDGRYGRLVPCGDEQALADAMEAALDDRPSPELLKARAEALSGDAPVRRYVELLTGETAPKRP